MQYFSITTRRERWYSNSLLTSCFDGSKKLLNKEHIVTDSKPRENRNLFIRHFDGSKKLLQFHDHYEHVVVIADSYKGIFEDKLIALYPHDAFKRLWCENWASWPRHTFIEHLKLIYPQITIVADKTFLAMIKDLKFEFDLDDIKVTLDSYRNFAKSPSITTLAHQSRRSRQ